MHKCGMGTKLVKFQRRMGRESGTVLRKTDLFLRDAAWTAQVAAAGGRSIPIAPPPKRKA